MCHYMSFILTDDERLLRGTDLNSHNFIEYLYDLEPGTYRECEWTKDDNGESLTVRVSPYDDHNENWYKSIILAKYSNRKSLEKYLISSLDGEYRCGDGSIYWFKRGKLYRKNGPAVINNQEKSWYKNGKLHREDGPAIEYNHGGKEWWKNGKRHRIDGPAIEYITGIKEWWKNGKKHRLNGPAIEHPNGYKCWYRYDLLHRIDGPAVEYNDVDKEWWKNGKRYYPYS